MTDPEGDRGSPAAPREADVVVGIGASAGGLAPLEELLRRFTLDSMAFVVVQHFPAGRESRLTEILQRCTSMVLAHAAEGVRVEANHLYVAPPDAQVVMTGGVLHLMPLADERPRQPVDFFFRSLAEDRGARAIGVVLSGTGTDGTLGLKAIKAAGGLTFAQAPGSARFEGMPANALLTGAADVSLAPEEIADELMSLSRHAFLREGAAAHGPERLGHIFALLRDVCGHDLSLYKRGTIERRVERRMALQKIDRLDEYVAHLQSHPQEVRSLYRDLLIGVTSFFRDVTPFEALRELVFPRLLERREGDAGVRVWVPGCSTGEEAYSVAIALMEFLGEHAHPLKLQVFATDVDDESVQFARRGVYPQNIRLDVSPERLERFFVARPDGFQVSRRLRDAVVFATQDVTRDPPFSRLDLVSCRNLLIYFQPALQKRVLRIFHYALAPEGHLLLGTSEGVGDSPELFSLVDRKAKIYRTKSIASPASFAVSFGEGVLRGAPSVTRSAPEVRPMGTVQQLADRRVLERYGPPGVVVNEGFEVLQFRGRTGPYLEPQPGTASLHLLKLARPELVTDLRAVVQRALEGGEVAEVRGVVLRGAPGASVDLVALPLVEPDTRARCVVVLFNEGERAPAPPPAPTEQEDVDPRVRELERDLAATREYLQSTIEDLETSNEELKSANEELQSSNEELQSTNEELETSKEELQSTNEELTTVNDELHSRMSELGQSNDDVQNLLAVIDSAIVIVGVDLRIRHFTHAAEHVLRLIPSDIGRPVAHLAWLIPAGTLERMIRDAVELLTVAREEVATAEGRRFRLTAAPYRTGDHTIRGAVLTFLPLPIVEETDAG